MKMDMEELIERLLAKLNANHKEIMARIDAETSHPSRNESHARQEDESQYECLPKRDDPLPRSDRD
jgi:hypothetical protein